MALLPGSELPGHPAVLTYLVGRFSIVFASSVRHERYEGEINGVKFFDDTHCYDVVCHPQLGERLLITRPREYGHLRDMPFHMGTARFLPDGVLVEPI